MLKTEDQEIITLYWERSERAIQETAAKYGNYCRTIARNVLANQEDAEESVNDTFLAAWNTIPPHRPAALSAYLGKITRNLAIDRLRTKKRDKRGGGEVPLALEELEEVVGTSESPETAAIRKELTAALNRYLASLPETERYVFLRRYWYLDPIRTIAERTGFSASKVASMLYRMRGSLRKQLVKEELL